MNLSTKLDLIQNLQEQLDKLDDYDPDKETIYARDYEIFRRRAEMIIRITCGENSKYITYLNSNDIFSFDPNTDMGLINARDYIPSYHALDKLLRTIEEEFLLIEASQGNEHAENSEYKPLSNKVFVVHGHDEAMKQAVARTLDKLQLDPIILHEKPSAGRTIIEKFSDYADVSFAVVLLSPDDLGYLKDGSPKKASFRARQNVIFELGYFLGKLGRKHVSALHISEKNFEIPSDYAGVLFIPFDAAGQWRFELIKELQACGFDVDANKLTR